MNALPEWCLGATLSTLGAASAGWVRHSPRSSCCPVPRPRGKRGYLRSSPTFRVSHSILVSSMLLRPKGHSCLSSRLLFSSTICKQRADRSHREESLGGTSKTWAPWDRNRSTPAHQTEALGAKLSSQYIHRLENLKLLHFPDLLQPS